MKTKLITFSLLFILITSILLFILKYPIYFNINIQNNNETSKNITQFETCKECKIIFYLHIPKSGGSSMWKYWQDLKISYKFPQLKGLNENLKVFEEWLTSINNSDTKKKYINLFHSHNRQLGMVYYMPILQKLKESLKDECNLIIGTILRNPFDRFISHMHYMQYDITQLNSILNKWGNTLTYYPLFNNPYLSYKWYPIKYNETISLLETYFDIVQVIENPNHFYEFSKLFNDTRSKKPSINITPLAHYINFTSEQLDLINRTHWQDWIVYNHFRDNPKSFKCE